MASAAEQLEGPPLPVLLDHLWVWFGELCWGRTCGLAANPITWSDVDGWSRLTGTRPTLFELRLLYALDACLIAILRDKN